MSRPRPEPVPFGPPRLLTVKGAIWAFDKPSGMPVHPGEGAGPDLIRWGREHADLPAGSAPIHRLDQGTSGLVLVSPDRDVRAEMGALFAAGEVQKEYRALVHGRARRKGTVRRALSDARRGEPLEAVTRYRLLQSFPWASYLRVRPETGRKHQIRRHLQGLGHAIAGDDRYRPQRFRPIPGFPGRLWLHAYRLRFPDGMELRCPLAPELHDHLELLHEIAQEL